MNDAPPLALGLTRRLPVILQTEAAECALACLAMIANHHGHGCDLGELRRRFPASLKGTTLAALIAHAGRLGLSGRALRLSLGGLTKLRCPCILHWNFNHFVVLKSVRGKRLTIHDPACGARTLRMRDVSNAFTGVALELWPGGAFERRPRPRPVELRRLVGRVDGLPKALAQTLVLALTLELCALLGPLLIQWVVDDALVSADVDLLTVLAVGFAGLVAVQQLLTVLRAWMLMHCGAVLNLQWHGNLFSHLLRLPMTYFEKRHLGDIVSRFGSIDTIQRTLTTAFVEAVMDGLMSLVVVVVLFAYNPRLSFICLGAMGAYLAGRCLSYRPLRAATEEQIVHTAKQHSHLLETLRAVRTIKLFNRQEARHSSWLGSFVDQLNAGLRLNKLSIACQWMNGALFGFENVLVVYVGAQEVLQGHFTVGMLMAFLSYKRQFSTRVSALIDKLFDVKLLRLHAERLADIAATEPEPRRWGGRLCVSGDEGPAATLDVEALRFRYAEHEPYVLDGVELSVAAGEAVAITGASGCGKTTLLQLMVGICRPTHGDVRIDGLSLACGDIDAIRQRIGSVLQTDSLFAGSIAENISFFDDAADPRRVEACARRAAIHEEIRAMPMAYNTLVGFMGAALSAGQQQRILIARALYARPRILFLDEATSQLDVEHEEMITAALSELGMTRIIVAHRPQAIARADRVVTLAGGRLAPAPTTPAAQRRAASTPEDPALALLTSTGC